MKIATIIGARPQFIKAAPVCRSIAEHNKSAMRSSNFIYESIIHTGQHYDHNMSQVFFDELEISEPKYNLGIGSGSHGKMTGAMLESIESVLLNEKPDWVLVYGDTNSTLAGALSAVKLHIPVAHVEAGLRSFNRRMPEEINRVLTDHMGTLLFCPTERAVNNLKQEGITNGVFNIGDVMYDAMLYYRKKAVVPNRNDPYALASLHRAENTDDPDRLRSIFSALNDSPVPILLPLHPRTRKVLEQEKVLANKHVEIVEPLSYFSILGHLEKCAFVLTDSGGMQKEAYFFDKKCITVRDETEWTELVDCGANRVVGAESTAILDAFQWALNEKKGFKTGLYGDGDAGKKIVRHLVE